MEKSDDGGDDINKDASDGFKRGICSIALRFDVSQTRDATSIALRFCSITLLVHLDC